MRVVLKPGGLLFLLLAIGILGILALVKNLVGTSNKKPTDVLPTPHPIVATGPSLLDNGDFEGDFAPVKPDLPTKSKITGQFPSSWYENSGWATLDVAYSKETAQPHSGKSAVKVALGSVTSGQVQLVHKFTLPEGTKIRASVWLRSDKPVPGDAVQVALREAASSDSWYATKTVSLTTEWKEVAVEGTISKAGETFLMIMILSPNSTVYVDDATLRIDK